jgi:hypothetical protein
MGRLRARLCRLARRLRVYMHAGRNLLDPVDDHALARLQSIANQPQRINLLTNVYRLNVYRVVAIHNGDLIAALQFGDSLLRNKYCAVDCFNCNAHLAVLSRAQKVARIWKRSCDFNCAGALVNLAIGKGELSLVWINGSVGENQLEWRRRFGWSPLSGNPEIFLLAYGEIDLDGIKS